MKRRRREQRRKRLEFTFRSDQTLSSEISEYTHTHTGNKDSCDWLLSLLSPLLPTFSLSLLLFSPLLLSVVGGGVSSAERQRSGYDVTAPSGQRGER